MQVKSIEVGPFHHHTFVIRLSFHETTLRFLEKRPVFVTHNPIVQHFDHNVPSCPRIAYLSSSIEAIIDLQQLGDNVSHAEYS